MQFMDNVKLREKGTIGIFDSICVNQATHTVNLRKESEMYKDMTMKEFNKEVANMTKNARAWVSLYIVKAMHAIVYGGKKTIKISHFFK
jgi:hypothetical protein